MEEIENRLNNLSVEAIREYYEISDIPSYVSFNFRDLLNDVAQAEYDVNVFIHALHKIFRTLEPPLFNSQVLDQDDEQICMTKTLLDTQINNCIHGTSQEYRILFIWLLQHYSVLVHNIRIADIRYLIHTRIFGGLFPLNIGQNNEGNVTGDFESRVLLQVMCWHLIVENMVGTKPQRCKLSERKKIY